MYRTAPPASPQASPPGRFELVETNTVLALTALASLKICATGVKYKPVPSKLTLTASASASTDILHTPVWFFSTVLVNFPTDPSSLMSWAMIF